MAAPKSDKHGVKQTYRALVKAGYDVGVLDGAGEFFVGLDPEAAVEEVMSCDEGHFYAMPKGETDPRMREGWVYFVYGNSPEEVICDYTTSLDHVVEPLSKKWGW